jgi:hypothetical protein
VQSKKSIKRLFNIMEGPERSEMITTIGLPNAGFRDTLASNFVSALNEVIDARNQSKLQVNESVAKNQIQAEKQYAIQARETVLNGLEGTEAEMVEIRSQISGIEFELSTAAKKVPNIIEFLTYSRTASLIGRSGMQNKDIQAVVNFGGYSSESIGWQVDHVIQLIAALLREAKIDSQYALNLHKKISDINFRYKKSQSILSMRQELESNFSKNMSEKTTLLAIDRSKNFLPRFKLNIDYYRALHNQNVNNPSIGTLEKAEYSYNVSQFVIFGSIIGGMVALAIAFISLLSSSQRGIRPSSGTTPADKGYHRPENASVSKV